MSDAGGAPDQPSVGPRLQVLDGAECEDLLATGSFVGRVAFVRDGAPFILPVNYIVDAGCVLFRTGDGTLLSTLDGERVAFEVDDNRPMARSGWSVIVRGTAHRIAAGDELQRVRRSPLRAWGREHADVWFRITPHSMSGRRIPEV